MTIQRLLIASAVCTALLGCTAKDPDPSQYGANPDLPERRQELLPNMGIAKPADWGDRKPIVPEGFTVSAIASGLGIPRQILVLPNGDILVAEGRGGHAPKLRPKDVIAGKLKSAGTSGVKSGNRITLLRDADGDGKYETQTVFADGLDAPYGLALIGSRLYVANQGALVWFPYETGQTKAAAPPTTLTDLPSVINHHWTKALAASADGKYLYVGIGSNSNIAERGMMAEQDRAVVWEVDATTGARSVYASGIRNPTALTIHPQTGQLWAVVNERDELGPNLVPDYLTSVKRGAFYGWPYSYWGQHVDPRVHPQNPDLVAKAVKPDYSLGSHVASLGVDFGEPALGANWAQGAFVGEHGSWNRDTPVGYKVVFIRFGADGMPQGDPIDFATGFNVDGDTFGRPVGVTVDPRGAVLIADDLANIIWRVAPKTPAVVPTAATPAVPSN